MTNPTQRIAVIGGGVAAHSVLKAYLAASADSDCTTTFDIYSREAHRPYRRPAVNKEILIDGKSPDEVALQAAVFDGNDAVDVTLHLSSEVTAVNTEDHTLTVSGPDGTSEESWDQLVFATGAGSRQLEASWLDGRDTHLIRSPEHSGALRDRLLGLSARDNVAVIGGGVLGLEAAAAASSLTEATVTVLEMQDDVCRRMLPGAASRWLRGKHTANGVDIRCGLSTDELEKAVAELDPAAVVVSVGVERDTTLAASAGLEVDRGIVVDGFGRTSVPGVWAAGDCVEVRDGDRTVLPEDEGSSRLLGGIVGGALAGKDAETFLASPPKGWSRQFGLMLNIAGATGRPAPGQPSVRELVLLDAEDELVVLSLSPTNGGDSVVSGVTTVGRSPIVRKAKNSLGMTLQEVEAEFFADGDLIPATT
ncbi:MAG: FAD-dependent oxidoreductase [Mycobacteriaceae bacterium]|uniref:FAD-dependent oxidoreductase n=1 Tax=Corynebacterium sp. TaxID=1720 RepID=UPI003F9D785E